MQQVDFIKGVTENSYEALTSSLLAHLLKGLTPEHFAVG